MDYIFLTRERDGEFASKILAGVLLTENVAVDMIFEI